jgi:hypothetical protein
VYEILSKINFVYLSEHKGYNLVSLLVINLMH